MSEQPAKKFDLSAAFQGIIAQSLLVLGGDRCALFLRRPETDTIRLEASIGLSEAYLEAVAQNWKALPIGRTLHEPKIFHSCDALAEPGLQAMRAEIRAEGFRSLAVVPLLSEGRFLGALALYFEEVRDLSAEDRTAMEAFADLAAVAVESAQNLAALRDRSAQKEALREVTRNLTEDLEPAAVFSRICRSVYELLDVEFVRLFILDERTEAFSRVAAHGRIEAEGESFQVFPKGRGILWRVASQKEAVAVREVLKDPDWIDPVWAERAGLKSFLGIPLLLEGRVAGILNCFTTVVREFKADEIDLMRAFAEQAAVALKNAELYAQVRETGEWLDNLVRGATDGIIIVDVEGRVTSWNPAAERIYGYAEEEILGQPVLRIYPEGKGDYEEFWERLRSEEAVPPVETVRRRKDGTLIDVCITVSPVRDGQGEVVGFSGIHRDITDRKRVEKALRLTQFSVDRAGDAVFWLGPDGGIRYVNEAVCRYLGYAREELLSMTVFDINPDDTAETWPKKWRKIKAHGSITLESRHVAKDGRVVPVEVTANYLEFEGEEYSCSIVRDITERKRAEERFYASQTRFQNIIDTASDAIVSVDEEQRIVLFNKQAETVFGYLAPEVLGRPLGVLIPHRFRGKHEDEVARFGDAGVSRRLMSERGELYGLRKGGEEFPVEISISKVEIAGKLIFTAVVRDVTERKRLEAQLRQSQKLEALGQLASGVAHDFNNSLSVVLGRVELSKGLGPSAEMKRNLEIIEKAALGGARTVKRLQDFARKREDRPRGLVNLNEVVHDVAEMARPRWKNEAEMRGVRVEMNVETRAARADILGEVTELHEALINLVNNSLDAMPQGGRLSLATEDTEEGVRVSVTDTGLGMSPEARERALEPFFSTKGEEGTGLGLSMVYGIVQRHEGQISLESAPGKGTTVSLTFPVWKGEGREPAAASVRNGHSARVLVIEDEEAVADLLGELLREAGHEVVIATDPRRGIDGFREAPFDLVVTDLGMPGMTGWEVAKAIKDIESRAAVVLLTGWDAQYDAESLEEGGVDSVLAKPVRGPDLLDAVSRVLLERQKVKAL